MSEFIGLLKSRTTSFSIYMPHINDINDWIENELLGNPSVTAAITGFSYRGAITPSGSAQIDFNVQYDIPHSISPVFLARDAFEVTTAIATSLRLHLKTTIIVIDNRNAFVPADDKFQLIHSCREFVGEELQIHQQQASRSSYRSLFKNRIIVYKIETSYFDSAKDINDLSCILAEQAAGIRKACRNDAYAMLNRIMEWFRDNIEYNNANTLMDHSAVGLFKNRKAVCQGIAAYAMQLLFYCGIDARYVSGEGLGPDGWGPHGWNMVFIGNKWIHIDYTFELNKHDSSIINTVQEFRSEHRWDENHYSHDRSCIISNARKTLRHSILMMLPDEPCFSINGCIVDMSSAHYTCVVLSGVVYVSLLDVISIFGGCYTLKSDRLCVYVETYSYSMPLTQLVLVNNTWYTKAANLKMFNFSVRLEGRMLVIENMNCAQ